MKKASQEQAPSANESNEQSGGESPQAAVPPAVPPADPGTLSLTTEQLAERLERERRKYLRQLGFESEEQLKQAQEERERLAREAEEQRRAEMDEVERYKQDLAQERQQRTELEERYAAAQFERHVTQKCAALGVRNVEYAMFEVMRATDALEDGEQLDVEEYLSELGADDGKRNALGLPARVEQRPVPATTTPEGGEQPPPPPAGGRPPSDSAFGMDDSAWRARKAALGLG